MYIGEASKRTGTTPKAIRLYEQLGLLPVPERKGKYRVYNDSDLDLITIIKTAQGLGFKLSEMKALLFENFSCLDFPWEKASELIQKKIECIDHEMERLKKLGFELNEFLDAVKRKTCDR